MSEIKFKLYNMWVSVWNFWIDVRPWILLCLATAFIILTIYFLIKYNV